MKKVQFIFFSIVVNFQINRPSVRVYHGGGKKSIGGPSVKANRINQYFPNRPYDSNIIYSISAHIPPDICRQAQVKGTKIVSHINSFFYPAYRPDYEKRNIPISELHAMADYIVYGSNFARDAAEIYLGKPSAPYSIIYNSVDLNIFKPVSIDKHFTILAIGVHYIQHRLKHLILAMPLIMKKYPKVHLIIAGPLVQGKGIFDCGKETILSIIRETDFTNIEFIGEYSQSEAPLIYGRASVVVHLKHMDWTPNTVIEAMACGIPIVHAGNGGLPELVEKAGISLDLPFDWEKICTPDLECIAGSTIEAFENRKVLGNFGRQIAEKRYDLNKWHKRHEEIFNSLLKKNKLVS
ncbi:MAG: glycosyltransferase family 4 protein [Chitinispirillia bacterium]